MPHAGAYASHLQVAISVVIVASSSMPGARQVTVSTLDGDPVL